MTHKKKENLKRNGKKFILNLILIIFIYFLGLSIYKIVKYKLDENNIKYQIKTIEDKVEIKEIPETNDVEVIDQKEKIPRYL